MDKNSQNNLVIHINKYNVIKYIYNKAMLDEYLPFIVLGALGGFIRGLVGIGKEIRENKTGEIEDIRWYYFSFSLFSGILIGGVAGVFVFDPKYSILVGYAGTDFLESLYKIGIKK